VLAALVCSLLSVLLLAERASASPILPADTTRHAFAIGLYSHYGFIIPHDRDIRDVASSSPWGLAAEISLHFTSQKAWQYLQAYPRLGASLAYYNFDNPLVLGRGYALLVYAEPFLSAHKKFSFSFRLGAGLAYLDRVYDPQTNPDNLFYSTKISFPLEANAMANYRLNRHLLLRGGFTYKHISNGGIRQPNKGINFPSLTLGLDYVLQPADLPERQLPPSQAQTTRRYYLLALLSTLKDRKDNPTDKLPVLGITAYASQQIGRLSALTAGAEWVADFTIEKNLQDMGKDKDFQRGALLAGHELYIGRFRFSQQLGVYVYAPDKARDPVYQRYGLEYHTEKRLFWGINLKAHRHVADFLDARLGLRFQ